MSTTASQAPSQGFTSGFQSTGSPRFKNTDYVADSVDKLRISNLAKEPNPFEQSFGKSALSTDGTETPQSKPTLPSISLISQSGRFFQDEPVKLSPMVLDPAYKTLPQTHHSLQNPIYPPLSTNHANTDNQVSANSLAMSQYVSASIYSLPSANSHSSQLMHHPYRKSQGYLGNISMDPTSLISNNSTPLLHLNPYSSNGMLPSDFKGRIPMVPPLYSIPTSPKPKRSAGGRKRLPTEGMSPKKIDFLERNRKAALKCRQRKKDEFRRVEESIKMMSLNNNLLTREIQMISQEALKLRTLLITHGGCPVAQKAGIMGEVTLPLPTQMLLPIPLSAPRYHNLG